MFLYVWKNKKSVTSKVCQCDFVGLCSLPSIVHHCVYNSDVYQPIRTYMFSTYPYQFLHMYISITENIYNLHICISCSTHVFLDFIYQFLLQVEAAARRHGYQVKRIECELATDPLSILLSLTTYGSMMRTLRMRSRKCWRGLPKSLI